VSARLNHLIPCTDIRNKWLFKMLLQGNVWFSNTTNITLTAHFIIVQRTGVLSAGSAAAPHPVPATILLAGTRQTPQLAISNDLVLGSKVGCFVELLYILVRSVKAMQQPFLCNVMHVPYQHSTPLHTRVCLLQ
jgi:hypothetical protein